MSHFGMYRVSFLLAILCVAEGTIMDSHKKLIKDLLQNYDKRIRPYPAVNETLSVTFSMWLLQILDVDEKNQVLNTCQWIQQVWYDNELSWDPADYDGIELIELPDNTIWHPDIALFEDVDMTLSQSGFLTTIVNISHEGKVDWSYIINYKSSCEMNVKYYPFDTQNCSFYYGSWIQPQNSINLTQGNTNTYDPNLYTSNSEFELVEIVAEMGVDDVYPFMGYHVVIQRRPLFSIFNLMCPSGFITMVAMLAFYIPPESGEKLGLGITVLLSLTVFLLIVSEEMPPTASDFPLIATYYFIMIMVVSLSTAMSVFSLNLHHRGTYGQEIPRWVRSLFFGKLARLFHICVDQQDDNRDGAIKLENQYLDYNSLTASSTPDSQAKSARATNQALDTDNGRYNRNQTYI